MGTTKGGEKGKKSKAREVRDAHRALALAERRLAAMNLDWEVLAAQTRDTGERIALLQERLDAAITAVEASSARLRAADDAIARLVATVTAFDITHRLDQLLVAQTRTNELLDLALGVAVEGRPLRS